jgi:hypothetical protein
VIGEQSLSWEADRFSASQEFPHILLNPEILYHIHNSLQLSLFWARSIQSMPPPLIYLEEPFWHYSSFYTWIFKVVSLPQVFPPKPVYTSPLPHTCYMPRPSHMWLNIFINAHLLVYRTMQYISSCTDIEQVLGQFSLFMLWTSCIIKLKALPEFLLVIIPCKKTRVTRHNTNGRKCFKVRSVCRWLPLARLMGCFYRRYVMTLLSHVNYRLSM